MSLLPWGETANKVTGHESASGQAQIGEIRSLRHNVGFGGSIAGEEEAEFEIWLTEDFVKPVEEEDLADTLLRRAD